MYIVLEIYLLKAAEVMSPSLAHIASSFLYLIHNKILSPARLMVYCLHTCIQLHELTYFLMPRCSTSQIVQSGEKLVETIPEEVI